MPSKVTFQRINKYKTDGSFALASTQTALKVELFNAAGTTKLYEVIYPVGTTDFELPVTAGTYVFKLTILDTVTAGKLSVMLVDEVVGNIIFNSGSTLDENNKVYTSPASSVSNEWFNLKIYQSSNFVSQTPVAAFDATSAMGICTGVAPDKMRRVSFGFSNYTLPLSFSTDNVSFFIFNPNGFYREGPVGDSVTYYFKDNAGQTKNLTIAFTDCEVPPPTAPTLDKTQILNSESVQITFSGSPVTIKVYEGNSVRQTITNQTSPVNYTPSNLATGEFSFSISNGAGESAKSAILKVTSAGGTGGFCHLKHLDALCTWNEPTEGSFTIKGVKFSNSGSYPWPAQIVSDAPLKFILRGKNILNRSDVTLAAGISTASVDCLSGNTTGVDGLLPPTGFPMPAGYELVGNVYQPIGGDTGTNTTERIKVNVLNFCSATAATVQVGITNNYTSLAPAVTDVTVWKDGLETDVLVQNGVYPWVFVRDKNNPTNVSNPTQTLNK